SDTLDSVVLKWFLEDLCAELRKGGYAGARTVRLTTDLPSLPLAAEKAVPLGLLVTEGISNAFRHAFVGRETGLIQLSAREDAGTLTLTIEDDGVGAPADTAGGSAGGLGRSLMASFARQLGGDLDVQATPEGTHVTVAFPLS
ncbi:MAG TPA: sensor histidine kinase, partial [Steroidobacteraceae bacterium]|nr:sensor histidine kinase [Steroidobacteraceae bacterium]